MDGAYWSLLDIRAGVPSVYPETADAFVPQMANLQLIDGVSFTKGCYTGQEVVARMQYLGKLKRRMYLAEVEAAAHPAGPATTLYVPGSTSEQASGRVVDARPSGDGRYELLAVVEIEAAEGGEVRLGAEGPRLTSRPRPTASRRQGPRREVPPSPRRGTLRLPGRDPGQDRSHDRLQRARRRDPADPPLRAVAPMGATLAAPPPAPTLTPALVREALATCEARLRAAIDALDEPSRAPIEVALIAARRELAERLGLVADPGS